MTIKNDLSGKSFDLYYQDTANIPCISKEMQEQLIKHYKETGDIHSRNMILLQNQKFITTLIQKYARHPRFDKSDLIQEANLAFIDALTTYEPEKGTLSFYTGQRINWQLKKYILSNLYLRCSKYATKVNQYNKRMDEAKKEAKVPTDEELMQMLKIGKRYLQEIKKSYIYNVQSYNVKNEETDLEIIDVLPSEKTGFEWLEEKENMKKDFLLHLALKSVLNELEYYVLYHKTLRSDPIKNEIFASLFHVSQTRIFAIFHSAKETAQEFVPIEESNHFSHAIENLKKKYGTKLKSLNPYPLNIEDILHFLYIEPILNDIEKIVFYEKYVKRDNFSDFEYAKMYHLTLEEIQSVLRNVEEKISIIYEEENFNEWKEYYLKRHKTKVFTRAKEKVDAISDQLEWILNKYPNVNLFDAISSLKIILNVSELPKKIKFTATKKYNLQVLLKEIESIKQKNQELNALVRQKKM